VCSRNKHTFLDFIVCVHAREFVGRASLWRPTNLRVCTFLCAHIFCRLLMQPHLCMHKYLGKHKQPQRRAHSFSHTHPHKQTPDGIQNSIKHTSSETKSTFRICPLAKLWQLRPWWRPGVVPGVYGAFGGISFVNSFLSRRHQQREGPCYATRKTMPSRRVHECNNAQKTTTQTILVPSSYSRSIRRY